MRESYVRHTGHNIMDIVSGILNEFHIPISQRTTTVYATTTDNGSNFVKCGKLMRAQNKFAEGEE